MRESRRSMLAATMVAAAGILTTRSAFSLQMRPSPQPQPSPNAPRDQNVPAGLDNAGVMQPDRQPAVNPVVWTEVQKDTDKLFQMVSQFRDQINRTNLSSTLPLGLLKDAHKIEKLAKEIQDRMKNT